jgi:hypothetical protein
VDGALFFLSSQSRFPRAVILLVAGWVFFVADVLAASAQSQAPDGGGSADRLAFAIPAQPLEDALFAYAKATGVEVFVDHALIAGWKSEPVEGLYDFEAALRRMLQGTGLEIQRAAPHAYTLVAIVPREPPVDRAPGWLADRTRSRFFAAVQTAVKQILCPQPDIAPGQYRAALAIWTDPTGRVVEARLLGATIEAQNARRLLDTMKGISVGQPPPPGLEQPITFVILPRQPDQTGDCAGQKADRG